MSRRGRSAPARGDGAPAAEGHGPERTSLQGTAPEGARPRRRWWPLALTGIAAITVIAVGAGAGFALFGRLMLHLQLKDQPGAITLPPEFEATARVTNVLDIVMRGTIKARVPFRQRLDLPLEGRYRTEVELDTVVPVKFEVTYEGTIPVDTIADIEARANFNFQDVKGFRNMNIKAKLPMKMNLPVKLTAPVDTGLRFAYKGPMVMGLNQTLRADVDTLIDTSLKVDQRVSAPVTAEIPLRVFAPRHPIKALITQADLSLALGTLRLERTPDPQRPQRAASDWGPAAGTPGR